MQVFLELLPPSLRNAVAHVAAAFFMLKFCKACAIIVVVKCEV